MLGILTCVLDAMSVAKAMHDIYDHAKPNTFSNGYHGYYSSGFSYSRLTKPDIIIVEGYYGTPVSRIYTPVGKLMASGIVCTSPGYHDKIKELSCNHSLFDMHLLKDGYQTETGYYGPWWQIIRVGDHYYPPISNLDEAWADKKTFGSFNEQLMYYKKLHAPIFRTAYETGVHNDVLGLTQQLFKGDIKDTKWLKEYMLKHNKNNHIYEDFFHSDMQRLIDSDGNVDWEIWHKVVHNTHLNC